MNLHKRNLEHKSVKSLFPMWPGLFRHCCHTLAHSNGLQTLNCLNRLCKGAEGDLKLWLAQTSIQRRMRLAIFGTDLRSRLRGPNLGEEDSGAF